ncbi:MAG: M50 family metallopeptidase [Bryobacteraceae bacterium]
MEPRVTLADIDPETFGKSHAGQNANRMSLRQLALSILVGIPLGILMIRFDRAGSGPWSWPVLFLGPLIAIAVHELGHTIAGLVAGFRTVGFSAWPLTFYKTRNGWRLRWFGIGGGLIQCYPARATGVRGRMFWMTAGGPIASIALFLLCGWMIWDEMVVWPGRSGYSAAFTGVFSLMIGVLSLVPTDTGEVLSDGYRMRMLARGGAEAEQSLAHALLATESFEGRRPGQWSAHLVERASKPESRSATGFNGQALLYSRLLDQVRVDEAEEILAWLLEHPRLRLLAASLAFETAWFLAAYRGDAARGREWMEVAEKQPKGLLDALTLQKARAAVACVEQSGEAKAAVEAALRECDDIANLGAAAATRDALLRLAAPIAAGM